ncbi:MAG: hypothetical protein WBA28_05220 [Microbacteriaceae bacterium]
MHWNSFFDDLEGQLEQELFEVERRRSQVEERFRMSTITLRDRIAAVGAVELPRIDRPEFVIQQPGFGNIRLRLMTLGRDWFSADRLGTEIPTQLIMSLSSIGYVVGAAPFPIPVLDLNDPQLVSRISYGFFLRDLSRRRVPVKAFSAYSGSSTPFVGTIDSVSRDHLELVLHDFLGRRAAQDYRRILIPLLKLDFLEL